MSRIIRTYFLIADTVLALLMIAVVTCALREEVNHEWLGIALIVLMAGHLWINRGGLLTPLARISQGKLPSVQSITRLVIDVLLIVLLAFMAWSSVVISQHAFWWLPSLPGTADARAVHLACSYWVFVLSFVHAGQHIKKLSHPAICCAVAASGIWAAWQLSLLPYLLLQVDYPIADLTVPIALVAVEHTLVAALAALIGALLKRAAKAADVAISAVRAANLQ